MAARFMTTALEPARDFCEGAEEVAGEWVVVIFEGVAGGGCGGEDCGLGDLMGVGFVSVVVAVDVVMVMMVILAAWFMGVCGRGGSGSEGKRLEGWWGGSERWRWDWVGH